MGASSGPLVKLIWGNDAINLTNSNDVKFWIGGWVNTDVNHDIGGQSPKKEFIGGHLTDITNRCVEPGSLQKFHELVQATTRGDVDITVELNNGDKYTAPCFSTVNTDDFFGNMDATAKFNLHPRKGVFSPL
jgi:hypothetical protein